MDKLANADSIIDPMIHADDKMVEEKKKLSWIVLFLNDQWILPHNAV